eukprot:m.252145 g.252145  ORF g.252145 m.252145 type:complete len:685 (-) comp17526_c0_seq4:3792-5846(-)
MRRLCIARPLWQHSRYSSLFRPQASQRWTRLLHSTSNPMIKAYEGIPLKSLAKTLDIPTQKMLTLATELDPSIQANTELSWELVELIADEFEHVVEQVPPPKKKVAVKTLQDGKGVQPHKDTKAAAKASPKGASQKAAATSAGAGLQRPPIVTIMGHVDHGKTTLLDAFRSSSIAAGEAGGITQHIGAFQVSTPSNQTITFLDTPGHAAFSAMRQRGAFCTDVVILVVAADDGVMPQTKESIRFAKEAGVPIVVAINKCDKPEASPDRVRTELATAGIELEIFGGDVQCIEVSALQNQGLVDLEDAVLLQAEIAGVHGSEKDEVEGVVIEASSDKFKGQVATILLRNGTVRTGDFVVAGESFAKVKSLVNDANKKLKSIGPSMAAEVMGWRSLPQVGVPVTRVANESQAREAVEAELRLIEEEKNMSASEVIKHRRRLEGKQRKVDVAEKQRTRRLPRKQRPVEIKERDMLDHEESSVPERLLLFKTDVQGSIEALTSLTDSLPSHEVRCRVVKAAVGAITDSDIELAATLNAWVVGFGVKLGKKEQALAQKLGVRTSSYDVVYTLMEHLEQDLLSLLPPTLQEKQVGKAKVLQVFKLTGQRRSTVAGCRVQTGELRKNASYKVLRKGKVVHEGSLSALMHHKDSVQSVKLNMECGASFADYTEIQADDELVCFEMEEVRRQRL